MPSISESYFDKLSESSIHTQTRTPTGAHELPSHFLRAASRPFSARFRSPVTLRRCYSTTRNKAGYAIDFHGDGTKIHPLGYNRDAER